MNWIKQFNPYENVFVAVTTLSVIHGIVKLLISLKDTKRLTYHTEPNFMRTRSDDLCMMFVRKICVENLWATYHFTNDSFAFEARYHCRMWSNEKMALMVWNDCIVHRGSGRIYGITPDSRRTRHNIIAEVFPDVIANLILDYIMPGDVPPS